MEPLFSAVICGCNAGLFREALHEVYIPRIQRGTASFAAKFLGVTGPLLSILIHFFQGDDFGRPLQVGVGEQSLTPEDRLFVLMQAAQYLTTARGLAAPEVRICYERAESYVILLVVPRSYTWRCWGSGASRLSLASYQQQSGLPNGFTL